ncbi:MAG: hypothetical protein ACQGVK_18960 [Myxococcota bacterium]
MAGSLEVECENGEPVRFGRGAVRQRVAEVIDRWPGEDHLYVRVRTEDGAVFILRHDERGDLWAIHHFEQAGGAPELR